MFSPDFGVDSFLEAPWPKTGAPAPENVKLVELLAPKPKPAGEAEAISAKDERFLDADRSTPFTGSGSAGGASPAFKPKLNPANGEGFGGSDAAGSGLELADEAKLAKLKVEAGFSGSEGLGAELPNENPEAGAGWADSGLPNRNPLAAGAAGAGAATVAGAAAAGVEPKMNPDEG